MIRTHLVKSLYENLLGPEGGPDESMGSPYQKYQIGILESCFHSTKETPEHIKANLIEDPADKKFEGADKTSLEDSDNDNDVVWPDTEIDLAGSFTLGLSFVVSGASPKIRICNTWGRYNYDERFPSSMKVFQRFPNFYLTDWLDVESFKDRKIKLVGGKGENVVTKLGIELHLRSSKLSDDRWTVQVFLVNRTEYRDKKDDGTPKRQDETVRVFQPQIRIKTDKDSKISKFDFTTDDDEEFLSFSKRGTKARGFQCGAVWADVDPESYVGEDGFRSFLWPDGSSKVVPRDVAEEFTWPDIRTEFLPTYSILQPEQIERTYDADFLSKQWSPAKIEEHLKPIVLGYEKWISGQKKTLDDFVQNFDGSKKNILDAGNGTLDKCKESLERIKDGIEFVCSDERARLAFCFMNVVMSEKRRNDVEKNLHWREFQMAFILQSLRGVVGVDKGERDTCDVLWYPTGGGKTEAYMGITIFVVAYRRLLPESLLVGSNGETLNNDGGVAALSRYTLRLLTIQQFQRALGAFVVADIKRVKNWLPDEILKSDKKFTDEKLNEKFLSKSFWGRSRFSIGLWIGGDATPVRFAWMGTKTKTILNAEGILLPHTDTKSKKVFGTRYYEEKGDPAQVQKCPICKNILCIPQDSLSSGMLEDGITWIISTSKTIAHLNSIPKEEFETRPEKTVRLKEKPTFSEISELDDGRRFVRVTMKLITKIKDTPRERIDRWWDKFVSPNFVNPPNTALASTSASFPGYFFVKRLGDTRPYDFAIFCTNAECELNRTEWSEYTADKCRSTIPEPFAKDANTSTSVPISAFTIDEQVYSRCPTFIIATSDKFASLPWDPRCASLFGNTDTSHIFFGYGRQTCYDAGLAAPILKKGKSARLDKKELQPSEFSKTDKFLPPSLIIQDELHLIEGPLGSMVGAYELPIDIMCKNGNSGPKYIASSATIKEADTQVGTIFRKHVSTFPAPGIFASDNFFSEVSEDPSCIRDSAGRLYLGFCSAKSTFTLPIRTCAILMSEIYKIRENPEAYGLTKENVDEKVDPYWTYVSYFTDLQLMSRFSGFYNDDINRDVGNFSPSRIGSLKTSSFIKFEKGTRLFSIPANKNIEIYGLSVYCENNVGSISVALYDENGNLLKDSVIKREGFSKGQVQFSCEKKLYELKKDQTVTVAIKNDSDETLFRTTEPAKPWLEIEQNPNNGPEFPAAVGKTTVGKGDAIMIQLSGKRRSMHDDNVIRLSSETKSSELPRHLDSLQKKNYVDALLTSPVFGTGIDVDRLGLMNVMNQPKTTSGYIQATGRVGRLNPGLVVTWLRARRARDLDHYENFVGYHRIIHSQVEPVTANPFSREALELCIGPVMVALLRNASNVAGVPISNRWIADAFGPEKILDNISGNSPEINAVKQSLMSIAASDCIPAFRKNYGFENIVSSQLEHWLKVVKQVRKEKEEIIYGERNPTKPVEKNVVLGTQFHEERGLYTVYDNTRSSLRDTESSALFYNTLQQVTIRPSQFLTRYGPGSLLPSNGISLCAPTVSSMIADLRKPVGNFSEVVDGKKELQKNEMVDSKMKKMLMRYNKDMEPENLHMFSMPTNASLNSAAHPMKDFDNIYQAVIFPGWGICSRHEGTIILAKIIRDERRALAVKCPRCWTQFGKKSIYSTSFSSVRLVLACKNGHMSDLDWNYQVHNVIKCNERSSDVDNRVFEWIEAGGGDDITFSCYGIWKKIKKDDGTFNDGTTDEEFVRTKCHANANYLMLKGADSHDAFTCGGEFVEYQGNVEKCTEHPRLVFRSMMGLRSPIVLTSLLIKPRKSRLFEQLLPKASGFLGQIDTLNEYMPEWTPDILADKLEEYKRSNQLGRFLIQDVRQTTREELEKVAHGIGEEINRDDSDDATLSQVGVLDKELTSLEYGVQEGAKQTAQHGTSTTSSIKFPVRWKSEKYGFGFEAMPFNDIKVTTVQPGYTREISTGIELQDDEDDVTKKMDLRIGALVTKFNRHTDSNTKDCWYIGNQNNGEGIFIHLDPKVHEKSDDVLKLSQDDSWKEYHGRINKGAEEMKLRKLSDEMRDSIEEIQTKSNPLFIWWHTLAHQIIAQLAIDSGFATTSIAERVYCIERNGKHSVGIFIYVSSPGSDGTLGGLTSLVDDDILPKIIEKALTRIETCSCDPVCSERKFNERRKSGAACHACIMAPETTCAYRNQFLDRNLIKGTLR